MQKQEYKNSKLSKKKIASAYLKLLIENPENLNVTEIVKNAGINRGTFYLHFENIKAVDEFIQGELALKFKDLEEEFREIPVDITPETILNKLNEILLNDIEFYKLIIKAGSSSLMEKIKNIILVAISNNFMIMRYVSNYERFKVVVQYVVGGSIDTYINWLNGNIDCTLEELCENLTSLIKHGLKGVINYGC